MDIALQIFRFIFHTGMNFFAAAATLVFLHCFYDTGFQWTKKKILPLVIISLLDALIYQLCGEILYTMLCVIPQLFITIIAVYDFRGKKIWAGIRYYLVFLILTSTPSLLSTLAGILFSPESLFSTMDFDAYQAALDQAIMAAPPEEMLNETVRVMLEYLPGTMETSTPIGLYLFSAIITTIFFGFIFFYLYHKLYKHQIVMRCSKWNFLFLILYPITCLIIGTIITVPRAIDGVDNATILVLTCISLLAGLLFPLLLYYTRINQYYRERTIQQENYMQSELAHFAQYKQTQEETARFRHDIRNHLHCINNLLLSGNTQEATQYLHEILDISSTLSPKYVSGDEMLDCIIGVKAGIMEESGIDFQLDGVLAGGLTWKSVDICNVFGNALDNAIEACQQLPPEKRYITMNIKSTLQFWFVSIENPVARPVDTGKLFQKNGGYTSKANASKHGMGTYNMKNTVESNGGILKAACSENVFTLEIMIDKSSPA